MSEPGKPLTNSFSWSAYETWIAIGLFLGTVLSRIPFRSRILYHWDSVNFAFAMREFNLAKEQPQPPGYIVYVWLCRLVDAVVHDAQTTMVIISIGASALAVVALFCLGRTMFNTQTGLIAALFLATSPLFWFYGEIALPHSLDTVLVILSAWWLYETMRGRHRYLYMAVAILAIAGGVRQQTIIFLAPVLFFALRRVGWKRFLIAGVLGAVICLAWFVPLMQNSGGIGRYLEITGAFTGRFQSTTSVLMGGGWWGIRRNLIKLTMYTLFGWGSALVPIVIYAVQRVRYRDWPCDWQRALFLGLWIAPVMLFYTFVHMGQQGLVFVFLPALLLMSAASLMRLSARWSRWAFVAPIVLVMINMSVFCLGPEYPLAGDRLRLLTRATLVNSDRYYADRFEAIKANFAPESTAILADDWHHVEYYLPGYLPVPFDIVSKWEKGEGEPMGNPREVVGTPTELGLQLDGRGQAAIIVFDPELMAFNESSTSAHELALKHGGSMGYYVLSRDQTFHYGEGSFGVQGY
jgi:hypothetical protein